MTNTPRRWSLALLALLLSITPAFAGDTGILSITLRYAPQESVGSESPTLMPGIADRPVKVVVEEGRTVQDPAVIGETTDDDDKLWPVRVSNSLTVWAAEILTKNAGDWGVRVADGAPLTLHAKILRFKISESNKALGSTYNADVQVALTLNDAKGRLLWEGTAPGDATRYGKSRSEENVNEVLSDALKEAYATGLAETGLQNAWLGKSAPQAASTSAPSAAPAKPAETITPEKLVSELIKLKKSNVGPDLMIGFIDSKSLSRSLEADDVAKLSEAGIPEAVIKAALERSKAN